MGAFMPPCCERTDPLQFAFSILLDKSAVVSLEALKKSSEEKL